MAMLHLRAVLTACVGAGFTVVACSGGGDGAAAPTGPGVSAPDAAPTAGSCADGERSGSETDVDCGGGNCAACADGKRCAQRDDCQSLVCTNGVCAGASCQDALRNQGETDVDCGGPCAPCGDGKTCVAGSNCATGQCVSGRCAPGTCADGTKNQNETDVDCGGGACSACADGRTCTLPTDCTSGTCDAGRCVSVPVLVSVAPAMGPTTGGTLLTLDGSMFRAGSDLQVSVGGTPATDVTWVSDKKITARVAAKLGGHGLADVVVRNPGGRTASLPKAFRFYLGSLAFAAPRIVAFDATHSLFARDFDGDGKVDLLVSGGDNGQRTLRFRKGQGDGSFAPAAVLGPAYRDYGSLSAADINGDGRLDILSAGLETSVYNNGWTYTFATVVMLGLGNGTFATPVKISAAPVRAGALADVDGDGKLDIVTLEGPTVSVLSGNGDGTFAAPKSAATGIDAYQIRVADLNGDGKADVVLFGYGANVRSFLGSTAGLTFAAEFSVPHRTDDVALGALSGDAKQVDVLALSPIRYLAYPNFIPASLNVRPGIGGGAFGVPGPDLLGGRWVQALRLVDMNLDGQLDVLASIASANFEEQPPQFTVRTRSGTGFEPHSTFPLGVALGTVLADVDGDGKPDVLGFGSGAFPNGGISVVRNVSQ